MYKKLLSEKMKPTRIKTDSFKEIFYSKSGSKHPIQLQNIIYKSIVPKKTSNIIYQVIRNLYVAIFYLTRWKEII